MSYPRKLNVLIIEDETELCDNYTKMLTYRAAKFGIADFVFACSYEDGLAKLNDKNIWHLVILDLGLPPKARSPVEDGIDPGLRLLKVAAERDAYPIPAILVVSGRLGGNTSLSQIRTILENGFWYGGFVNKGALKLDAELDAAIHAAQSYCDVGIHIRETDRQSNPGLSPREVDLLRRCVLKHKHLGVDLEWWCSEEAYSPAPGSAVPWKKVLLGNFLLDDGMGTSRTTFFKFEPTGNAGSAHLSATVLGNKLQHVKVVHKCSSHNRGMLVTECVSLGRPVSLDEFMTMDKKLVQAAVPRIVSGISAQLQYLGKVSELQVSIKKLLWQYHQPVNMTKAAGALELISPADARNVPEIFGTFLKLKDCVLPLWIKQKQCNHGDLHAQNIAVDIAADPIQAFIFDAGPMKKDVNVRDLAQLEVTMLLWQEPAKAAILVDYYKRFYEDSIEPPIDLEYRGDDATICNTLTLLAEIRRQALQLADSSVYALMLFDQALIQIGGLALVSSRNKIRSPRDAWKFALTATGWVRRALPEVFAYHGPSMTAGLHQPVATTG